MLGLGLSLGPAPIQGVRGAGFAAYGSLTRWRAARTAVLAGASRALIVGVGDSTTAGVGAGAGLPGRRKDGYPAKLAAKLSALGLDGNGQSFMGNQNASTANTTTFDPRLVLGAGWVVEGGIEAPGMNPFRNNSDTTALSWTPDEAFDTVEIYYLRNTGLGTISWDVDGGSATNIVTTGAEALAKATVTVALGLHTVNIKRVSGACYVAGVVTYNSATKAVDVINAGRPSATTTTMQAAGNAWSPLRGIPAIAAHLYIIDLGINDWNSVGAIAVATYKSQLAIFAAACYAAGDVILRVPVPSDPTWQTMEIQSQYRTAIYEVAQAGGYVVADMFTRWTSRAASVDKYYDNVHPNEAGYIDEAEMLGRYLRAA